MNNRPLDFDANLINDIFTFAQKRVTGDSDTTTGGWRAGVTHPLLDNFITKKGLGGDAVMAQFVDRIVPTCRANESQMNFAFVAASPSSTALAFESVVASLNVFGGNWDNAAGAIQAENHVLRWLADCAGFPDQAGGAFVSGGTQGNLSALVAARSYRETTLGTRPQRWVLVCSAESHSSIASAAKVMDAELITIPSDDYGRMRVDLLDSMIPDPKSVFAIVGNAGATNCGAVDDLRAIAAYAKKHGIWLHVDGAYGLGALAGRKPHELFDGLELADSFIVDPHKWLFTPYDSCALVYRNPEFAAEAHAQKAVYLDAIKQNNWNPSNYAIHLSRRLRGLSLWFSLSVHGTDAYEAAIEQTLETTDVIAEAIEADPDFELMIPASLSIILFRKRGMSSEDMQKWGEDKMRSGEILCLPTKWRGEDVFRLCLVHPNTQADAVIKQLKTM